MQGDRLLWQRHLVLPGRLWQGSPVVGGVAMGILLGQSLVGVGNFLSLSCMSLALPEIQEVP